MGLLESFFLLFFFLNCSNNNSRSSVKSLLVLHSITCQSFWQIEVASGATELNLTVLRNFK